MKFVLTTLVAPLIIFSSISSSAKDDYRTTKSVERDRVVRIYQTRPVRLDGPLRVTNISDDEVREIEAVMSKVMPGSIVNIGGVTAGCPCEDGASCDSQVWVVADREDRSQGLMLSRIAGLWTIGPLQEWWRRYDLLRARIRAALASKVADRFDTYRKLREQQLSLQQDFPSCGPKL